MARQLEACITIQTLHSGISGCCLPITPTVSHAARFDILGAVQEYKNMKLWTLLW